MRITGTSQSFYGCRNIISDDIRTHDRMVTFISAQLNDEEKADLAEYKKLKTMLELPTERVNNDSISMIYTHIEGQNPNLFIDNQVLFWGGELRWLKENRPKAMSLQEYQNIEATHMKAYTLLASITKRIMYGNLPPSDSGINNVIKSFMSVMNRFANSKEASFEILQHSFMSKMPPEYIAENFNNLIVKTMNKFLR